MMKGSEREQRVSDVLAGRAREQALADGRLIDVTGGRWFPYPVAVTRAVYDKYVRPREGECHEGKAVRIDKLLMVLCMCPLRPVPGGFRGGVRTSIVDGDLRLLHVKLEAVRSTGDDGKPVLTVMLPEEA